MIMKLEMLTRVFSKSSDTFKKNLFRREQNKKPLTDLQRLRGHSHISVLKMQGTKKKHFLKLFFNLNTMFLDCNKKRVQQSNTSIKCNAKVVEWNGKTHSV